MHSKPRPQKPTASNTRTSFTQHTRRVRWIAAEDPGASSDMPLNRISCPSGIPGSIFTGKLVGEVTKALQFRHASDFVRTLLLIILPHHETLAAYTLNCVHAGYTRRTMFALFKSNCNIQIFPRACWNFTEIGTFRRTVRGILPGSQKILSTCVTRTTPHAHRPLSGLRQLHSLKMTFHHDLF